MINILYYTTCIVNNFSDLSKAVELNIFYFVSNASPRIRFLINSTYVARTCNFAGIVLDLPAGIFLISWGVI